MGLPFKNYGRKKPVVDESSAFLITFNQPMYNALILLGIFMMNTFEQLMQLLIER